MATCCQSCEIMARYKYWIEHPTVKHTFLTRMSANFHLKMAIPKEFKECFKGELAEWCILKGPSGNAWRVRVIRSQDDIVFKDGWVNFVKDHGLRIGDSCVFTYAQNSTFELMIFKQSGSEREGAYFSKNSSSFPSPVTCSSCLHTQQSNFCKDQPNEDEVELDSKLSGWFEEKEDDEGSDDSCSLDFSVEKHKSGKREVLESTDDESDKLYEVKEEDEDEDVTCSKKRRGASTSQGAKQRQTVHISSRREVMKEEIEKAYKSATNYVINNESKLPRIQITTLPTHVYQGFHMTIKKDWALQHMCHEDHDVKIKVEGMKGSWVIGCRWTPRLMQCQLRVKWQEFVRDTNLEEHDVLVFELIRKGKPRSRTKALMNIHIFRVVDQLVPLKKVRKFV